MQLHLHWNGRLHKRIIQIHNNYTHKRRSTSAFYDICFFYGVRGQNCCFCLDTKISHLHKQKCSMGKIFPLQCSKIISSLLGTLELGAKIKFCICIYTEQKHLISMSLQQLRIIDRAVLQKFRARGRSPPCLLISTLNASSRSLCLRVSCCRELDEKETQKCTLA